jgi:hypothetical protein
MPYNVFLYNGLGISAAMTRQTLSAQQLLDINRVLQGYFDSIVKAHDTRGGAIRYGFATVQWLPSFPTVAPHELLIYLLPAGARIVKSGKLESGSPPASHDGLTNPNLPGGTGSEVYYHFSDATLLANLMFHEAMHNKLRLDDHGLHGRGGLAATPVEAVTKISTQNIADMASALGDNRPQWTAGIRILVAETMRPDSDPAKGLF